MFDDLKIITTGVYRGLNWCVALGPSNSFLNGYVELPENHSWIGRDYETLEFIDIHGGITYTKQRVIGFDTAHAWDIWSEEALAAVGGKHSVYYPEYTPHEWDIHWTLTKVIEETTRLAEQVHKSK